MLHTPQYATPMTVSKAFTEEFKREVGRLAKQRGNINAAARDQVAADLGQRLEQMAAACGYPIFYY